MGESGSADWFEVLVEAAPALLAAFVGTGLVIFGIVFALRLADVAKAEVTRNPNGSLKPGFEDAWWALRHAAYFCLAVVALGVLLLLAPAFGSAGDDDDGEAPSASAEAETNGDDSDKPGNRGNRGRGNDDREDDEDDEDEAPESSSSPAASGG